MRFLVKAKNLKGKVKSNTSKAEAIRQIIIASQLDKKTILKDVNFCDDVGYLVSSLSLAGIKFIRNKQNLTIYGNTFKNLDKTFNAGESGAVLRFLIPLFLLKLKTFNIKASNALINRPLDTYYDLFKESQIDYKLEDNILKINAKNDFNKNTYEIDINKSSQFASGIALLAPSVKDISIKLLNDYYSKSYFSYTINILKDLGSTVEIDNNIYMIIFNNKKKFQTFKMETDFSNLIYWLLLSLYHDVKVSYTKSKYDQPDYNLFKMLESVGYFAHGGRLKKFKELEFNLDFKDNLDLVYPFVILAISEKKKAEFTSIENLKYKESDRLEGILELLKRLRIPFKYENNKLSFDATKFNKMNNLILDARNDHRVIMSYIVLASMLKTEIEIINSGSLSKSSPDFLGKYVGLGGQIVCKKK